MQVLYKNSVITCVVSNFILFDFFFCMIGKEKIHIKAQVGLDEFELNYLFAIREDDERILEKEEWLKQLQRLANGNGILSPNKDTNIEDDSEIESEMENESEQVQNLLTHSKHLGVL